MRTYDLQECWHCKTLLLVFYEAHGLPLMLHATVVQFTHTRFAAKCRSMEQGVEEANPYLTGLSSFLGFAVYGAQGVLLGPLIICLATLIYGWLGFLGSSIPQVLVSLIIQIKIIAR